MPIEARYHGETSSSSSGLSPDLGKTNGKTPDRGRSRGHTPDHHPHPTRELKPSEIDPPGNGEHRPTEKARPWDTDRGGA